MATETETNVRVDVGDGEFLADVINIYERFDGFGDPLSPRWSGWCESRQCFVFVENRGDVWKLSKSFKTGAAAA